MTELEGIPLKRQRSENKMTDITLKLRCLIDSGVSLISCRKTGKYQPQWVNISPYKLGDYIPICLAQVELHYTKTEQ